GFCSPTSGTSIIYLGLPSLAGSIGLPVAAFVYRQNGSEQLPAIRNLFGLSTPGVYRDACCHTKPWALTPRFHPCSNELERFVFCGTFRIPILHQDPSR